MRYLKIPSDCKPVEVYITCVISIKDMSKRDKYYRLIPNYARISLLYKQYGQEGKLYKFPKHSKDSKDSKDSGMLARNEKYSVINITVDDMKDLYKSQMLKNKKPRKFYDTIMGFAKLGKCPFCSLGQVTTLDHFLPKSEFPSFSVLPYNLVPCCKDCNHGKSASYAKLEEEQTLHPYYDNYDEEQWLFAEIIEKPFSPIKYEVIAPETFDDIKKTRIKKHFEEFYLGKRFAIEAISELAILKNRFQRCGLTSDEVRLYLIGLEKDNREEHINSWQTAMYQALSKSKWYCNGGYNDE